MTIPHLYMAFQHVSLKSPKSILKTLFSSTASKRLKFRPIFQELPKKLVVGEALMLLETGLSFTSSWGHTISLRVLHFYLWNIYILQIILNFQEQKESTAATVFRRHLYSNTKVLIGEDKTDNLNQSAYLNISICKYYYIQLEPNSVA